MQRELCLSILSNLVLNFPLFKNSQHSFVAELAKAHCWDQLLSGDLVADEGYTVQEVLFVMQGLLQAWSPSKNDDFQFDASISDWTRQSMSPEPEVASKCIEVQSGAWFGETCLFDSHRVYTSLIVATTECELAILAAADYIRIVKKYPWLWERHQEIEKGIHSNTIGLEGLRYVAPEIESPVVSERKKSKKNLSIWELWRPSTKVQDAGNVEADEEALSSRNQQPQTGASFIAVIPPK